jgi:hypothetical protein
MSQPGAQLAGLPGRFEDIYPPLSPRAKALAGEIRRLSVDIGATANPFCSVAVIERASAAAERLPEVAAAYREALKG